LAPASLRSSSTTQSAVSSVRKNGATLGNRHLIGFLPVGENA
jgi:hypothetical protein